MTGTKFPARIMHKFVEALSEDIGQDAFSAVLQKAGLPKEWAQPAHFIGLDDSGAAQAYSRLQSAFRKYYGRGARGILMRIGAKLWIRLLDDSTFGFRAQAAFIRGIPKSLRRKPTLDLLGHFLSADPGIVTVHTLDLDLLLVDQTSPSTLDQLEQTPICYVTLGLIRESLFWANGHEHDVEERACRAQGARQCEFTITLGG